MIREINRNQKSLAQKSEPATKNDQAVLTDLLDTLRAHQDVCVGMAANMIGVHKRVIIVQMGVLPVLMINPEITAKSDPYTTSEGCLSLLGERQTTRYQNITVKFLNKNFKPTTQKFTDFVAQIIQHEVDHCDGIII
ncbi:peptide deformylase [Lapidilactobacillus dextrinicus DSM 20335]|uniref:Peptide deformylase n=1 Tax=Lapidilactobacillus dextrinicus DSM 20335 TaxID=1423738 RepID=A0A0R2BLU7_9LACO|nr:peptide deformylase [Lapidilactobacillus dextrinicus]KRM79554.1 peptide deformylase [Lapidilactobacillus dextrinicus DSM 20335]QFG46614.1 peptide deformylase [Lapidilactobacillus dextrinicus]